MTRGRNWPIQHLETTESTNADALQQISAGETGPCWITATQQTKGRGRLGRRWDSPETGNLYASLIYRPECPLREVIALPLAAALAVRDTVAGVPGIRGDQVRLKWPNDVLVGGAKISGILIETTGPSDDPVLIIGIGINVAWSPEDLPYPATHLRALAVDAPRSEELIRYLDRNMQIRLAQWKEQGAAGIRTDWMDAAAHLGQKIDVRLPDRTLTGIFSDMNQSGALILQTAKGPIEITAGDVFVSHQTDQGTN